MGQFTGLFNGLENVETKKQPKPKSAKSEKRSLDKPAIATPNAKPLRPAKAKPKAEKPRSTAAAPAPMRGKRSHPDYTQAPAFVRKNTYKAVKIALLNGERGLDYSDLVEELLTTWLKSNK